MKIGEMLQLPVSWVWTKLGDVCIELIGGGTPSRDIPEYFGDNIIWLTPTEVPKDKIVILNDSKEKITELGLKKSSAKIIPKDSVLLTSRASIGYVAIAGREVTTNQGFASFVCSNAIYNFFLAYWLWANKDMLESNATGTTFKEISKTKLREFYIPLPPLPEQRRIVAKLEELFTRLDAGVKALKKTQAQLKRYRQSVLKAACEGKLVPTEAELARAEERAYEPADVLPARIKEYLKKNAKSKFKELPPMDTSDLPELPEGWAWTRVEELYGIVGGGTPSTSIAEYWEGDIPWITSADIYGLKDIRPRKQITRKAIENSATNLVPEGSLIVVTRVGLGKIALTNTPMCFSQDSQALIGNNSLLFSDYSLYYLSKAVQIFKYHHRGTTIAGVTKKQLSELAFALPPLAEQHRIVSEVERRLSVADEVEKAVELGLRQAERLRQSILKRAFEGKLVPQDPSDEPASMLLERIKAEKSKREAERKGKKGKNRRNTTQMRLV